MSDILQEMKSNLDFFVQLRHQLHENPEIGFDEKNTSKLLVELLRKWGYEVTESLAVTGLVASLKVGQSDKVIGIRADMDALPIQEASGKEWSSTKNNRFHGCGHDGHTTILLCAAKYLAEHKNFDGTIHLIFQPAEETLSGGRRMLEDGLFEKFPCDVIFALHNMPGFPAGHFYFKEGAVMACSDTIHIEVTGKGAHGAMPEMGVDATLTACYIATALQSIVSRNVSPQQSAVITIGSIQAGDAPNVINQKALLKLTVRAFDREIRDLVVKRIEDIAHFQAESFGAKANISYINTSPVLKNDPEVTKLAKDIAENSFGKENVSSLNQMFMGSEDFAFMLDIQPKGCYFMIGNGDTPDSRPLHNPGYDFNDDLIPLGASYWIKLIETYLEKC